MPNNLNKLSKLPKPFFLFSKNVSLVQLQQHNFYSSQQNQNANPQTKRELTAQEKSLIDRMIRVDQAGETAAVWIYRGQKAILGKDPKLSKLLDDMKDQEKVHLDSFNKKIVEFNARPTIFQPVAAAGGFALGAVTALLGVKAAMTCTEAVETAIGMHYNNQLRELYKSQDSEQIQTLMKDIKLFRDQELEHLDTAVENGAKDAPFYNTLSSLIKSGCNTAIWLCEKY
ncbi:hypothetical protein BB561_003802 [Smittium simulii]|uniref:5-demethoxyubiquinone hydroxylase, mitochondrial n=1 Tax=Smittium simulii TaxID=133385 RepID=A0A2T9YJG9_9FUNG|nr:hypothetical protein BB561_003802 [Smittium simulii]